MENTHPTSRASRVLAFFLGGLLAFFLVLYLLVLTVIDILKVLSSESIIKTTGWVYIAMFGILIYIVTVFIVM